MNKRFFSFGKIQLSQLSVALAVTAIIFLIHNFNLLSDRLDKLLIKDFSIVNFYKFSFEFGLHFFLIFTFLFLCSFNKIIFRSASFTLLLLSTIFTFIYNKFCIIIDQSTLANALENTADAENLINFFSLSAYLILFLILPFIVIYKITIIPKNNRNNFIAIAVILTFFATILAGFDNEVRRGSFISYPPINLIDSICEYFNYIYPSLQNKKVLKPINEIIPDAKSDARKIKNLKVIFIIGESARSKNFSIDGYNRETTPLLKKQKNLISFRNVSPCNNLTSYSVSCILSSQTSKEFSLAKNNEESIIKLFEKLGFTTAWFSTQKAVGDNNTLLMLAIQSQKYFFGNTVAKNIGGNQIYDEYLLEYLDKEIDNNQDNFVILHTQGSHFLFDERYPDKFRKFTPTCVKRNPRECDKQALVNAYDNSILYTDYFISKTIQHLKNKNAILFYVSDHGQFLGENGVYYHGNFGNINYPEHKVPMFLWMSDSVIKDKFYREKFKNAQLKTNHTLSHDNIFDSLLNCSGIDSRSFNRKLSLCGK